MSDFKEDDLRNAMSEIAMACCAMEVDPSYARNVAALEEFGLSVYPEDFAEAKIKTKEQLRKRSSSAEGKDDERDAYRRGLHFFAAGVAYLRSARSHTDAARGKAVGDQVFNKEGKSEFEDRILLVEAAIKTEHAEKQVVTK